MSFPRAAQSLLAGLALLSLPASAAPAADPPPAKNRPPHINGSRPRDYFGIGPVEVRWGKELRFQVMVSDPDGDALETRMEESKERTGATFEPNDRVVRWPPTQAQKGEHEIRFVVSDGSFRLTRSPTG